VAWTATAGQVALAACGASGAAPPASGATTQAPVAVDVATKFAAADRLQYATMVWDKFNELNAPAITARHVPLTGDALLVAISAGTGPDVTMTDGSWFSDFAEKGALRDVSALAKRDKVDLSRWFALQEIFTYKGKQYGMPFWQAHGLCAYNASLFRRYQVPLPTESRTWDTMLDAAKRLTKPGESWGLLMPFSFEFGWLNFMRAGGSDYLNKDRSKTTLNTPEAIDARQYVQDLVLKHRVMAPPTTPRSAPGSCGSRARSACPSPAPA
jgi:multiple sugar transport system substrate-binding protein